MTKEQFVLELEKIGAIKFGSFTLKSGLVSPFYFDLRDMISFPAILDGVADLLVEKIKDMDFDVITGIPYTALPIASLVASKLNKPLIYMRKEEKAYGTGNNVIGKFEKGAKCLVIDDLITTGASKIETAEGYEKEGVIVKDFVVVIDRSANGIAELAKQGYNLHSLISLAEIVELLQSKGLITDEKVKEVEEFTASLNKPSKKEKYINPLTQKLLNKMQEKKSNLVLSLDVTTQAEFFEMLDKVGEEIVMLKTHVDIIDDYDENFVPKLQEYSKCQNFLIFEDRKFADIGNTVRHQFRNGVYKIADWTEYVTVHMVAGEMILKGLFEGIEGHAGFVLARMSSKGNLLNETYTRKCFEAAKKNPQWVAGFIGHGNSVEDIKRFKAKFPGSEVLMMPGVKKEAGSDAMGQQYITIEQAVEGGADCIIVGRGILKADDPQAEAKLYRERAWKAYEERMKP
ncbi:MAG: orotidine-5'-phosphate decarboxylase [Candidatus Cloacimonetes bacterium]|nr:orotidine-5'-phosphate decarboxylase [Candidatus Cloacimonadota bacterium]MCF7812888.1 orotidine-5'-phosphate decarboxylase [Candidatus Cloacimonadota bacterium]MCF7867100.1 orotidine-5'-phosphate decarboxylase [Candidatus Cloacimonadota bacterium]MCF7882580.1 orotidine-5'-phosphate decarboxylase [Candidatus Cloacimonadota bacterium]